MRWRTAVSARAAGQSRAKCWRIAMDIPGGEKIIVPVERNTNEMLLSLMNHVSTHLPAASPAATPSEAKALPRHIGQRLQRLPQQLPHMRNACRAKLVSPNPRRASASRPSPRNPPRPLANLPCDSRSLSGGPCKRNRRGHMGRMETISRLIGQSLDRATYEGYRCGFEAARDEAAVLAERAGQGGLAARLRAMRPLPDNGAAQ